MRSAANAIARLSDSIMKLMNSSATATSFSSASEQAAHAARIVLHGFQQGANAFITSRRVRVAEPFHHGRGLLALLGEPGRLSLDLTDPGTAALGVLSECICGDALPVADQA